MEAVLGKTGKERVIDRVCRALTPICDCITVAAKRAREAEIEVPSKRRFREMLASGEASVAVPQESGTGLGEVAKRAGIGVGAFLECLTDAAHRAEESRTDSLTMRTYRRLPE